METKMDFVIKRRVDYIWPFYHNRLYWGHRSCTENLQYMNLLYVPKYNFTNDWKIWKGQFNWALNNNWILETNIIQTLGYVVFFYHPFETCTQVFPKSEKTHQPSYHGLKSFQKTHTPKPLKLADQFSKKSQPQSHNHINSSNYPGDF